MRYVAFWIIGLCSACSPILGPGGSWTPSKPLCWECPPPNDTTAWPLPSPHVDLTSVSVRPMQLRAGDQFTASMTVAYSNCGGPVGFSVTYADRQYPAASGDSSFALSLAAVLGDTVVTFQASCSYVTTPPRAVTIQVLPREALHK